MIKNKEPIRVIQNVLDKHFMAVVLRQLFDRKQLWEKRFERKENHHNGDWYTLGSALYLDLPSPQSFHRYAEKTAYFNTILSNILPAEFYQKIGMHLSVTLNCKVSLLGYNFMPAAYPGFHIFPGNESLCYMFGRKHKDLQFTALEQMPNFPYTETMREHFSVTLPLHLPFQGGGLLWGDNLEKYLEYQVGNIYLQTEPVTHAIAPYRYPVLPTDYRITLQAHGFKTHNMAYLYW